jgi:hypothetical protein
MVVCALRPDQVLRGPTLTQQPRFLRIARALAAIFAECSANWLETLSRLVPTCEPFVVGTTTIAETVDAALDEVLDLAARRRLLERIGRVGGIGPDAEELRRLRSP